MATFTSPDHSLHATQSMVAQQIRQLVSLARHARALAPDWILLSPTFVAPVEFDRIVKPSGRAIIPPSPPDLPTTLPPQSDYPPTYSELGLADLLPKAAVAAPTNQVAYPPVHRRLRGRVTAAPTSAERAVEVADDQTWPSTKPFLGGVDLPNCTVIFSSLS